MTHPRDETISAWLEGDLPSSERRDVTEHLEGCARCREAVEILDSIRSTAGEASPPWPGKQASWDEIADRIGAGTVETSVPWRRWPLIGLAAAAILATILLVPDTRGGLDPATEALLRADRRVAEDVIRLASRGSDVDPGVRSAVLDANREIDRGVDSLAAVLERRPNDPDLAELVRWATSHRIDLLKEVTR